MVSYEAAMAQELRALNRNLNEITRTLKQVLIEHRRQNLMFMKAYNLSKVTVEEADTDSREQWK
jgi:hypothetical protein